MAHELFSHLKPGGWIEVLEFNPRVGCDDGTIPPDYPLVKLYDQLRKVFREHYNFDLHFIEKAPSHLEQLGFVNVQKRVFHVPIGEWHRDKHLRTIGAYFREVMREMLPAVTSSAFPEYGIEASETRELLHAVQAALADRRIHAYIPVHVVWAQKPIS